MIKAVGTRVILCLIGSACASCSLKSPAMTRHAEREIKVEVGIRQNNAIARPIPFLPISVAPADAVIRALSYVHADHARQLAALETSLERNASEIEDTRATLAKAQAQVSQSFNEKAATEDQLPSSRDRDPLAKMMAAGAAKSAADRDFKHEYGEKIKPIEDRIKSLEDERKTLDEKVELLGESLPSRLFDALPVGEAKTFTTNKDGEVIVKMPSSGKIAVWAEASRTVTPWLVENYRWYVTVPGPYERDGRVVLGNANLLSSETFTSNPESRVH